MRRSSGFLVLVCIGAMLAAGAQGAVVHRYDFQSDPNDSVGGAHGTLINNTTRAAFAGGQLTLGNQGAEMSNAGNGDYVDLPNGIISALGNQATFEVWTTWRGASTWQRIFDLGTSDTGEDTSPGGGNAYYIFLTPMSDSGTVDPLRFGMNNPLPTRVELTLNWTQTLPTNTQHHIVVSWDGAGQSVKMFLNGELVDAGQMHFALSDLTDNNNWLGRAQWNDPMYMGSFNEFRIYDHAMSANEVAASRAAGTEKSPANAVSPAAGAKEVALLPTLEWAQGVLPAGTTGLTYALYFSNNAAAVQNRSAAAKVGDFPGTSLAMPAALLTDQTYYWVVDETAVLPGNTEPNVIAGGVVSFETIKTFPILTAPAFGYGLIGQSATLTVNIATLSDIVSCVWYKYVDGVNDIVLTDGAKYAIGLSPTATTLTIADVAPADAAAYYCVVENAAGPKTSSNIAFVVRRGLAHRYSFDSIVPADPNVIDSVGGKHGRVVVRTPALNTRYENGKLILGNTGQTSNSGTGDYVDLPNGMISALGNLATFEMWVSWRGPAGNSWQRIFDFGASRDGEDTSADAGARYYVMLTPRSGSTTYRVGYRKQTSATTGDERVIEMARGPVPADSELVHLALVWDGQNGINKLYYNGKPVAQGALHFALSEMPDFNNWLGRAQWNDSLFRGSYDEFRIYDIPLSDAAVLAHYQAGPNVVGADLPCTAYPAADANGDCKVDLGDLAVVADTWLTCGGPVCQ